MVKYRVIEESPDFGVFHLTVNQAADLIVLDMWGSGEIPEIEEPEDWDGNWRNSNIKSLLSNHTEKFKQKLIAAINKGMLNASVIKRDFDDELIPEETYLYNQAILDWLEERNYTAGDTWLEWHSDQLDIFMHVENEVSYAQAIINSGKKIPYHYRLSALELDQIDESADTKLLAAYKEIVIENHKLKEQQRNDEPSQKHNRADRPLTTRQRRTFLTIIAAVCSYAKIDTQARGASQRIRELTESLGASVDDGTIKTLLSEIPDALESRMK